MAEKQDLDSIDLQLNIPDGEFLVGAIVLLKTVDQDNVVALRQRTSTGISWTERLGMLHAAVIVETSGIYDDE